MQSPFTRYLDEKYQIYESYYEHHRLQPRVIKTKDGMRSTVSTNLNVQSITSKEFKNTQKNKLETNNQKAYRTNYEKMPPEKLSKGRNLFQNQIARKSLLGPGDYQPTMKRTHSFGYIQKTSQNKVIPSQKIKERVLQFLGPGRYSFQSSQNLLSRHKSSSGIKFNSEKLVRCILSKQKTEKIHIKLNDEDGKKQAWRIKLGPGFYDVEKSETKADKFSKIISFPVSMTSRSFLVKNDKIPGPGYYKSRLDMVQKLNEKNKKPRIIKKRSNLVIKKGKNIDEKLKTWKQTNPTICKMRKNTIKNTKIKQQRLIYEFLYFR